MIKAVKECVKNWLVTHERLYWYIIVGLAVFGFGLVTALGCAKLEKANAAEGNDFNVLFTNELRSYRDESKPLYAYIGVKFFEKGVVNPGRSVFLVQGVDGDVFTEKMYDGTLHSQIFKASVHNSDGLLQTLANGLSISDYRGSRMYELYYLEGNIDFSQYEMYDWITFLDVRPIPVNYSPDAPYVSFQRLNIVNRIATGETKIFDYTDLYTDYIKTAYWEYSGQIKNYDSNVSEYTLEVDFTAHLPTYAYINEICDYAGIDITWDHNILSYGKDLISIWYKDKAADKYTLEFKKVITVIPDSEGFFSYRLSYDEIELLCRYFNSSFNDLLQDLTPYLRAELMMFLHIDSTATLVKTTLPDSIVYGRYIVNMYQRGVLNEAVTAEIETDIINGSAEEIDTTIQNSIDKAYDEYYKRLQDRVDGLESELESIQSIQGAFSGELSSTDLWTGFTSLAGGLGSLAPAIRSLSVLTGAVFAFLPMQMSGIICFTLFAVLIIAIIKAIRG